MKAAEGKETIQSMTSDVARITLYEELELREKTVGDLAAAALNCFPETL
jgi:hypothetical protein